MPNMPKMVITIHGINTVGGWQESVRWALHPHFVCYSIKYPEYRQFGFILQLFGKYSLSFFLLTILIMFWLYAYQSQIGGLVFWGGTLLSFIASLIIGRKEAKRRRSDTLDRIVKDLTRHLSPMHAYSPSIIAHSFGTHLIGKALLKQPHITVDRVILTGAVLPKSYEWEKLVEEPTRVNQVRNEMGKKDRIVCLAGLVGWLIRDHIGNAGLKGFNKNSQIIHTSKGPFGECKECENLKKAACIHNIPIEYFTHSDHFIDVRYARTFWLPFLWGFQPSEFKEFLDACGDVAKLLDEIESDPHAPSSKHSDLDNVYKKFDSKRWSWWKNETITQKLREYISNRISTDKKLDNALTKSGFTVETLVFFALAGLCRGVKKACDSTDENEAMLLLPSNALLRAVDITAQKIITG
jgi:hypothetical protein